MSNIIQKIFIDHYEEIVYTMHPRPVEIENIERMINCGDPSFGGTMYGCPKCGTTMLYQELYFNRKRVPLEDLYERTMNAYRASLWRSTGLLQFYISLFLLYN